PGKTGLGTAAFNETVTVNDSGSTESTEATSYARNQTSISTNGTLMLSSSMFIQSYVVGSADPGDVDAYASGHSVAATDLFFEATESIRWGASITAEELEAPSLTYRLWKDTTYDPVM